MSTTFEINEQQMCWSIIHCDSSSSKIAEAKPVDVFCSQTFKDSKARNKTRPENEGKKLTWAHICEQGRVDTLMRKTVFNS